MANSVMVVVLSLFWVLGLTNCLVVPALVVPANSTAVIVTRSPVVNDTLPASLGSPSLGQDILDVLQRHAFSALSGLAALEKKHPELQEIKTKALQLAEAAAVIVQAFKKDAPNTIAPVFNTLARFAKEDGFKAGKYSMEVNGTSIVCELGPDSSADNSLPKGCYVQQGNTAGSSLLKREGTTNETAVLNSTTALITAFGSTLTSRDVEREYPLRNESIWTLYRGPMARLPMTPIEFEKAVDTMMVFGGTHPFRNSKRESQSEALVLELLSEMCGFTPEAPPGVKQVFTDLRKKDPRIFEAYVDVFCRVSGREAAYLLAATKAANITPRSRKGRERKQQAMDLKKNAQNSLDYSLDEVIKSCSQKLRQPSVVIQKQWWEVIARHSEYQKFTRICTFSTQLIDHYAAELGCHSPLGKRATPFDVPGVNETITSCAKRWKLPPPVVRKLWTDAFYQPPKLPKFIKACRLSNEVALNYSSELNCPILAVTNPFDAAIDHQLQEPKPYDAAVDHQLHSRASTLERNTGDLAAVADNPSVISVMTKLLAHASAEKKVAQRPENVKDPNFGTAGTGILAVTKSLVQASAEEKETIQPRGLENVHELLASCASKAGVPVDMIIAHVKEKPSLITQYGGMCGISPDRARELQAQVESGQLTV
ncbi:hypothetical protein PVAG01_01410 [Phlyctema vagabunda]|uniref:Uncharacterized protein n=1 Tax=Phlyctema vagabunda TaxID=108571 RepID=A0ABR4PXD6_9HELO